MIRNLSLSILILATSYAAAQPSGASAQAEMLFRRGKELMGTGKTAEACAAFDASEKLEPTISTRMNQANCREKNGQLATSWGLFLDAERQTRSASDGATKQLHKVALDRASKLEARLSSIQFAVTPDRRVAGLELLRDGDVVDPATWNTKLPVDGGTYKVLARAPGVAPWSTTVVIASERDIKTVEIPKLEPAPPPNPPLRPDPTPIRTPVPPGRPVAPPARPIVEPARGGLTMRRKLSITAAGVGVAGVVVGAVFGVSARGKQTDAEDLCPDPAIECVNAARATALTKSGHDRAFVANLAFGLGGAAIVGAAVLWLVGKPAEAGHVSIVPRVAPGETGVSVLGRF